MPAELWITLSRKCWQYWLLPMRGIHDTDRIVCATLQQIPRYRSGCLFSLFFAVRDEPGRGRSCFPPRFVCSELPYNPEPLADFAGGGGLVEGVEVDAGDALIEKVGALFGGIVEADLPDGFGLISCAVEGLEKAG